MAVTIISRLTNNIYKGDVVAASHRTAPCITAKELREILDYDPETGVFQWTRRIARAIRVGNTVGSITSHGYIVVGIYNNRYYLHRLAWMYVYGDCNAKHMDHINGIKSDNRISNLREGDARTNLQNQRRARIDNTSGLLGAHWAAKKSRRWYSRIRVKGKNMYLGSFTSAEAAHQKYLETKRQLHEFCTI